MATKVISKVDGTTRKIDLNPGNSVINLDAASVVELPYAPKDIASFAPSFRSSTFSRVKATFRESPCGVNERTDMPKRQQKT